MAGKLQLIVVDERGECHTVTEDLIPFFTEPTPEQIEDLTLDLVGPEDLITDVRAIYNQVVRKAAESETLEVSKPSRSIKATARKIERGYAQGAINKGERDMELKCLGLDPSEVHDVE
jgi:hypothetical protein